MLALHTEKNSLTTFFLFFFFFFVYYVVRFLSVLKSIFSIISAAGFRGKKKTKARQYGSRENYYNLNFGP